MIDQDTLARLFNVYNNSYQSARLNDETKAVWTKYLQELDPKWGVTAFEKLIGSEARPFKFDQVKQKARELGSTTSDFSLKEAMMPPQKPMPDFVHEIRAAHTGFKEGKLTADTWRSLVYDIFDVNKVEVDDHLTGLVEGQHERFAGKWKPKGSSARPEVAKKFRRVQGLIDQVVDGMGMPE